MLRYRTKRELWAAYDEQVRQLQIATRLAEEAPPNLVLAAQMRRDSESEGLRHWLNVNSVLWSVLPD
jgi:hypothetical protein